MARQVTHEASGPLRLGEDDLHPEKGDVAVCLCGLSGEYPFCDGSHRTTRGEEPGVLYEYDGDDADGPRCIVSEVVYAEE